MIFVFILSLGAIVGSFLNCVIYRLPRNLSLLDPKRSFCPACHHSLRWFENIPILSWLFLKGKCAHCHFPISIRYPLVEIMTSFLFWLCYVQLGFPLMLAGWIFLALLIAASFIDLEHLLIPDEITLGGIVCGLGSSWLLPQLMGVDSRSIAFLYSLTSALAAYMLLWIILELGKKIFGHVRHCWKEPIILELLNNEGIFSLRLGEEIQPLQEYFLRDSDYIKVKATMCTIGEKTYPSQTLTITSKNISTLDHSWSLERACPLDAMITQITLPREAMGFGDVKFLACIGAFLGFKGMLFSLFGGSIIGATTGCILLLMTRGRLGRMLPFGPYLACGGLLWIFMRSTFMNFL